MAETPNQGPPPPRISRGHDAVVPVGAQSSAHSFPADFQATDLLTAEDGGKQRRKVAKSELTKLADAGLYTVVLSVSQPKREEPKVRAALPPHTALTLAGHVVKTIPAEHIISVEQASLEEPARDPRGQDMAIEPALRAKRPVVITEGFAERQEKAMKARPKAE